MNVLRIPRPLLHEMISHCCRDLPDEACGLLAGKHGVVTSVLPMPNAAPEPRRHYLVDSAAQLKAFRLLAEKGWELVGIYHSHPTELPVPSQKDIAQCRYPHAVQVIVGLKHPGRPDVRAYRLYPDSGKAVGVRLEIEGGSRATYWAPEMLGLWHWSASGG